MERLVILRDSTEVAWATTWVVDAIAGHDLVAVPRLRLCHELALDLAALVPYAKAFDGTRLVLRGEPRVFAVIHAGFALYTTAEPDITGFACILPVKGHTPPAFGDVVAKTAKMLR